MNLKCFVVFQERRIRFAAEPDQVFFYIANFFPDQDLLRFFAKNASQTDRQMNN
jgi:hypothetical protein